MIKLKKIALTLGLLALGASMNAQAASCDISDVTAEYLPAYACAIHGTENDDGYNSPGDLYINTDFGLDDTVTWDTPIKSDDFDSSLTYDPNSEKWELDNVVYAPFVVVIKAANSFSSYLFTTPTFADSGTYSLIFKNANGVFQDASHISIYASLTGPAPGFDLFGNPVPLPAALWLFAPALLGFMGFRRKSKA